MSDTAELELVMSPSDLGDRPDGADGAPFVDRWHIDVTFADEPGFHTTAMAHLTAGLDHFDVLGSARKHPADPNVSEVAHVVATARALDALSRRLLDAANDWIRLWDDEATPILQ